VLSEFKLLRGPNLAKAIEVPLHSPKADFEQKGFAASATQDGNGSTGWAVNGQTGKPHHLTFQLIEPLKAGEKLFVRLDQDYTKSTEHTLGRFRLLGSREITEESIAPAEVVKILGEEPKRRNPVVIMPLWAWLEKVDPEVVAAAKALEDAKSKLPKPPLMDARVIAQRSTSPRATHLLHRGDFLQPAEEVKPGTLAVLPKTSGSTRLDFAKWLVSAENPLTPRVTVNHIWGKLFGEGLVTTAADFGVRGAKPTHPELLDYLAAEFMKPGLEPQKASPTHPDLRHLQTRVQTPRRDAGDRSEEHPSLASKPPPSRRRDRSRPHSSSRRFAQPEDRWPQRLPAHASGRRSTQLCRQFLLENQPRPRPLSSRPLHLLQTHRTASRPNNL
jgi:hypothetical protein